MKLFVACKAYPTAKASYFLALKKVIQMSKFRNVKNFQNASQKKIIDFAWVAIFIQRKNRSKENFVTLESILADCHPLCSLFQGI